METVKPIEFEASAGSYFVFCIVSAIAAYIPILGWAFLVNYGGEWFANHARVNGKQIAYHADYIETLKIVFVGALLMFITLGIYILWFVPKMYRYVAAHISYVDATGLPASEPVAVATQTPVDPTNPSTPVAG